MQDPNSLFASLSKLNNLTADEKGELGLLRSRIDEQSQLIMILKNRADEHLLRYACSYTHLISYMFPYFDAYTTSPVVVLTHISVQ